jgi:hypothetical protein
MHKLECRRFAVEVYKVLVQAAFDVWSKMRISPMRIESCDG